MKKSVAAFALASVSLLVLAGCAADPATGGSGSGLIRVTASTNVYGSLAAQIGGDRVEVTSIIDSASQDPHSYEASARDRLSVTKADLVIENGGGYDAFIDTLLDGSDAHVLTAVEFSHDYPGNEGHGAEHDHAEESGAHEGHDHVEGFNEHIWFDPHTMIHVVEGIAAELSEIDPAGEADFTASADEIIAELEGFETDLETLATAANGAGTFITEPLPGYLATAAGLTNVTPDGFAEAVEEGNDVAPATLLKALDVIDSGEVKVLLTNAQTGGAETQRVEDAASAAGIPVVAFTELIEDGSSYAEWMRDAIQNLAAALHP
ncbi:metal ABC transporter substrate-binding protein [Microbacterium sp. CH12i]|uniref:metal ABC transporter solute-binding protein, Zn/Mn family n=1 Tax=Microbacterium sp. CH12i TaxID=1479651 RepID=UPI000461922E|nr:zinc ABC transporter substrate-binding protein [Microbacterium sp. CH12i]KDA05071.1 metal ABC transporter substrate-binding protein [Microbacterium sp. CH12i]